MQGENKGEIELSRKLAVLNQIFDSVIDMTRHEDEKAGRILAPMAFLTAAYAAIFAAFLSRGVAFRYYSYDLVTIAFLAYVASATLGTIFILEAFGPRFNIPKVWKSSESKETQLQPQKPQQTKVPKSIFFFELIAKEPRDDWTRYFSTISAQLLEQKALEDLAFEIHLISEKICTKIDYVRRGKIFFFAAMLFLIAGTLLGAISILGRN